MANEIIKERGSWIKERRLPPWHYFVRAVALLEFIDQLLGPISSMPSSEGIAIACLGALFAPLPKERKNEDGK